MRSPRSLVRVFFLIAASAPTLVASAQRTLEEMLMQPHRLPYEKHQGLAVDLSLVERENGLWLISDIDVPYGGYIISPLTDRDYLGKYHFNWLESESISILDWLEFPPSQLGFEPFDRVMVPMIVNDTRLEAQLELQPELSEVAGELAFVLEPQCVLYLMPFSLVKTERNAHREWALKADSLRIHFPTR